MNIADRFAYDINDTESVRTEKSSIFLLAGASSLAGLLWWIMYYVIFGWGLISFLPLSFAIIVGSSLLISHITRNHRIAIAAQIICITYITAFIQWNIGSLTDSGLVLLWSFLGPITALMFYTIRKAIIWFALFLLNIAITLLLPNWFAITVQAVSYGTSLFFTAANLSLATTIVFAFSSYYVNRASIEQKKSEDLLLNILPAQIAESLKKKRGIIADKYENASILFADIVGFTPLSEQLSPVEMVALLNDAYSYFDVLVEKYGLEKIRTIGDNYMVASGVPIPREDHAVAIANFALDMLDYSTVSKHPAAGKIDLRVGLNSGPVVAGVIGKKKFQYDVWSPSVNVASRMESQGVAGQIQVAEASYTLLESDFVFKERGLVNLKGLGEIRTWFLLNKAA